MDRHLKILIFTKDENLGALFKECLKTDKYATETFPQAEEAYDFFCTVGSDLCIMDVSADKEEITLAAAFKAVRNETRLIFLFNSPTKEDIVEAYQMGADDLMRKPISLEVLQARIHAIMKRSVSDQQKPIVIYKFGLFSFNTHTQTLSIGEEEKKLTTKESDLLKVLCQNPNKLVDRSSALQRIWKNDSYFNARSMDVYITKLRHLLKADPTIRIENVHGKGYKLVTKATQE
ncbi:response regulator transcription factor [uncultured Parabacteroides sp.]|jgi:DNA-binding response OmpR family regulator|uniref:response regulator transcription factor n=1 Tax=uncultured Parabacteroides sp. TaxID=512312 RepID=UPI0025F9CDE4|nr:response regulator transcription factor [uncultured Parabacteroides sp.]